MAQWREDFVSMEVSLSSSAEVPKVRLVTRKTEAEIPLKEKATKALATAAPTPFVESEPRKAKPLTPKQQQKLNFELAKEMSAKNPGLSLNAANCVLMGQFTIEEWFANQKLKRRKNEERLKAYKERAKAAQEAKWALAMDTLEYQIWERYRSEQSLLWFETAWGDETEIQLRRATLYRLFMKNSLGKNLPWKKIKLASFGLASKQPDFAAMREIVNPEKRSFILEEKPSDRWLFPHELLNGAVGRRIRATLVNGSVWSGFLNWVCGYTFGLSIEANMDEASIVIFKHACCGIDLE